MTRLRTDWKRGDPRPGGKRLGEQAWEQFLCHLATMGATQASKRPGMPSRAAFAMRRRRHPAFNARASEILASRRLLNGGRRRITTEQWDAFLREVGTCTVRDLCSRAGMPSEAAVYKRRGSDPAFAVMLASTYRQRCRLRLVAALRTRFQNGWNWKGSGGRKVDRSAGTTLRQRLSHNALYRSALAAVPSHLNATDRDDIAAEMVLAVLECRCEVADLKSRYRDFARAHWKLFGQIGKISLDAPAYPGGPALIETLASEEAA